MAGASRIADAGKSKEICPSIAPTDALHRCKREPGHTGHHVYDEIIQWTDDCHCPHCLGVWDTRKGECTERNCVAWFRLPCVSCKTPVYLCLGHTICQGCHEVLCCICEQWLEIRHGDRVEAKPYCPVCLPAALGGAGSSREPGATENDLPGNCSVAPNLAPDEET